MVIGTGAEAEDNDLHLFNDSIDGYYSVMYMTAQLDTPLNKWFREYLVGKFGAEALPNPHSVGAYDGMTIIARMIENLKLENNSTRTLQSRRFLAIRLKDFGVQ